ncbi:MAG: deoxyribonuclease IV [Acidimicrobiia bacterium]|nr:deoxyribonuclease IV [Acidimicrobiia bacterium]
MTGAPPIGAHVAAAHPLAEAAARGADLVQLFLSNPQSWKKPVPRPDAAALRSSPLPIYVHAPYLINVASPNNRVRIPSRTILADTMEAAAAVGAAGVVVHGGHVGDDEGPEAGVERWRKALEAVARPVPLLLENTAGGGNAVLRDLGRLGPLWEAIGHLGAGFCLDTCHAWAAGEDLEGVVDRVRAATGRIDLVHCNDSRDPAGSGRDRHANLGKGLIPPALLVAVAGEAGAPVVVETPDDDGGQAVDIAWLRERLAC